MNNRSSVSVIPFLVNTPFLVVKRLLMLIKCCFMIGRMLLCVRERSSSDAHNHSSLQRQFSSGHGQKVDDSGSGSGTRVSHFLPTSRRIVQFANSRV